MFFFSTPQRKTIKNKNKKGLGLNPKPQPQYVFAFLLLLLLSLRLVFFLVVCFFLFSVSFLIFFSFFAFSSCFVFCFVSFPFCWLFSSNLSTSDVFTFRIRLHSIYFSLSVSSFSYFLFLLFLTIFLLFLLLSMYFSNMTPPQKKLICLYCKSRAGFCECHKNGILLENIALCCRVQTEFWEILFFKVSETQF